MLPYTHVHILCLHECWLPPGETCLYSRWDSGVPVFETSDVFNFVPFLHPILAKEGLRALCLGTKVAIYIYMYTGLNLVFLLFLHLYHLSCCSCFIAKWCASCLMCGWFSDLCMDADFFITWICELQSTRDNSNLAIQLHFMFLLARHVFSAFLSLIIRVMLLVAVSLSSLASHCRANWPEWLPRAHSLCPSGQNLP